MPLYPATKLMDTVITDLFDFPTSEPTAPQAVHTPGALLFSFSSEPTWTAIGNTDAHAPHGEDSWGLWQIDVDPTGASADLWEWRKNVEDGTLKDTIYFQPQLTSEPTAPEAGHVKAFQGRDASELTAPAGDDGQMFQQIMQQLTQGGSPPDPFDFTTKPTEPEQIKEVLVTSYNMGGDPLKFAPATDDNALTVDPTDPNASVPAHTPEWSNLRSSDPMETPGPDDNVAGLPAVQTDDGLLLHDDAAYSLGQSMGFSPDAFDFTTEPTEASMIFKLNDLLITSPTGPLYGGDDDCLSSGELAVLGVHDADWFVL